MAAIYMWISDEEVIVTTTPYPIEVIEGMHMGAELVSIGMFVVPEDEYQWGADAVGGNIRDIVISTGPHDDAYQWGADAVGGAIRDILLTAGPYDDAYQWGADAVGGNIRDAIVQSWMPDEGLHFGCTLQSISMSAV
jgi:hypothetical protein